MIYITTASPKVFGCGGVESSQSIRTASMTSNIFLLFIQTYTKPKNQNKLQSIAVTIASTTRVKKLHQFYYYYSESTTGTTHQK
jgi:hypothetical protein